MKEFMQKQRLHLHFEISSRRLQLMMNLGNIRALEDMGGVEGIAALLLVECDVGLSKEERLDAYIDRIEEYVSFTSLLRALATCTLSCLAALHFLAPRTSFGVNNFPNLVSGSITSVFLSYWSDMSFLIVLGLALVYFVRLVGTVDLSNASLLLPCKFNLPSLDCMRASPPTVRLLFV
jgi:hypothetical protein